MTQILKIVEELLKALKRLGTYLAWTAAILPPLTLAVFKATGVVAVTVTNLVNGFLGRTDGIIVFAAFAAIGTVTISFTKSGEEDDKIIRWTRRTIIGGAVFIVVWLAIVILMPMVAEVANYISNGIAAFYYEEGNPKLKRLAQIIFIAYLILLVIDIAVSYYLLNEAVEQRILEALRQHGKDLVEFSIEYFQCLIEFARHTGTWLAHRLAKD